MLSLWMLLACTGETHVNQLYPDVSVVPELLDFGEVVATYPSTLPLQVTNTGHAKLNITNISVSSPDGDVFAVGDFPETLEEDETQPLLVTFTPATYLTYGGTVTVESDSKDHPVATATVAGIGVKAPTPDIEVDPVVLDFGMAGLAASTNYFLVKNVGDGPLHVSNLVQKDSGAFQIISDTSFELAPGDSTNVVVIYTPNTTLGDHGTVSIQSDDPDEGSVDVTLLGNGGGDFKYPVAVIDGPSQTEPRTSVTLDGTGSYDPDGDALEEYQWTITLPEGSTGTFTPSVDMASLYTDIAGDYVVQLRVKSNEQVWSAPATLHVNSIPKELLHVELFWDTGGADLDLHLADKGADFFSLPDDVSYCNQTPDWGVAGTADDPSLDIDDRYGYGPENINIDTPQVDNYNIRVHYYVDNGDLSVVATVKVYLYGAEEASYSKVLNYNEVWDVADIKWSGNAGTTYVIENTDPVTKATHKNCYEP